jgi:uncharacterized protein (DUF885 family)
MEPTWPVVSGCRLETAERNRSMGNHAFCWAALCALASFAHAAHPVNYQGLVKAWYQDEFRTHPVTADYAGVHDWDDKLDDVSLGGHEAERKRLHDWLSKFEAVDPPPLSQTDRDDREVVIGRIKAALLEEESIQRWRSDPEYYSSLATDAVFQLVKRDYAPLADRLRFAIARERRIPDILATAKTVIQNPPKVFVEIALENIEGGLNFLKTGLPEAFQSVRNAGLKKRFAEANAHAIAALEDYKSWLEAIRPNANGNFAVGAENYWLKLQYEEMIDVPLDRLLEIAYGRLRQDQQALVETAHRIDPNKSPDDVAALLQKDHPTADRLIPTAREQLVALRNFIVDRDLALLPPERMPSVDATPEFQRALLSARMDPPGPLEKHATKAFYFITPPAVELSSEDRDVYLEDFDIPILNNISVHEVFPGHFIQLMLMRSLPDLSMVRRLDWAVSNVEGWAHYCEQMTLDEGFGGDDPKLRLGQILDALLRDARFVASIELHTRGMSVEQATQFFIDEGHQSPSMSLKEAKRGTSDPSYLLYTVGKLEILKLRDDWKAKMGDRYSIGAFHKRLMEGGIVPIKMIRREMLGEDGPLL